MPVTLAEVARRAEVSIASASRALSGGARTPAPDITQRVRAAADELGYLPNAQARALVTASSGLLGLVVHDIADPFFSSIARGVQQVSKSSGKTLLLASADGTPQDERHALEALASRRAEAIILAGSRSSAPEDRAGNAALRRTADRYLADGGKLVVIGSDLAGRELDRQHGGEQSHASPPNGRESVLRIPNEALSAKLARTLASQGHRRFTVLAGPQHIVTSDERLAGFQRGLREAGLGPADVLRSAFTRDGGYESAARLAPAVLRDRDASERRCIFAVSDRMARGLVTGLRGRSLEAPRDYAVAGFGGDPQTIEDFQPALTTLGLPLTEIGRRSVQLALDQAPSTDDTALTALDFEILLQDSTSTPRH